MRKQHHISRTPARGFTLVDLLVSMGVIVLLIAASLPSVSRVQEAGRRTVSASNIRQSGLALQMYAYDLLGKMPRSLFDDEQDENDAPEQMVFLRVSPETFSKIAGSRGNALTRDKWDGLGLLFKGEYAGHPDIFFNPSHRAQYTREAQAHLFENNSGEIVSNYHYRMPGRTQRISALSPQTALIADSMRSQPEYNHRVGNNMLKADMSIQWFNDSQGRLFQSLAEFEPTLEAMNTDKARRAVKDGWTILDDSKLGQNTTSSSEAHGLVGAFFGQ